MRYPTCSWACGDIFFQSAELTTGCMRFLLLRNLATRQMIWRRGRTKFFHPSGDSTMVSKFKRGKKLYITFYETGRKITRSCGTNNEKTAERIRQKVEINQALGRHGIENVKKKIILLSAFLVLYFEYALSYKKPATVRNERIITRLFVGVVGDRYLRELTAEMMDKWKSTILSRKYSAATFN